MLTRDRHGAASQTSPVYLIRPDLYLLTWLLSISPSSTHSCNSIKGVKDAAFLLKNPMKDDTAMPDQSKYSGMAALSICEALLLAMNDHNLLPEKEILGVLRDAAAAHENDDGHDGDEKMHKGVADLINKIISGGNSVRRR